ncbi:MAG: RNA pseudouridine synthase [Candidatus Accumulibacter sp.]|jgi:tRNA pseudouridine32 synthase/23S rRNA pseudouridine746 synthase|nr:RNA pseudouridine synthase [Accumulibacter sp.]
MTTPIPSSPGRDPERAVSLIHVDRALIVAAKPTRLLSVPGRGPDKQDCLIARLQGEFPDALIVHRLDFDTSGLVVLARGKKTQRALSLLFQERRVDKRYVAVVEGRPKQSEGEIDLPLCVDWPNRPLHKVDFDSGKPALTRYRVIAHDGALHASRLALTPETGRTHQLRVHMQALGHPILGDPLYAHEDARSKAERLLLHAERLAFPHPSTGKPLDFSLAAPF